MDTAIFTLFAYFLLIKFNSKKYIFFYFIRVTSPGHQGYLGATIVSTGLSDWQALGIELCLTFVITLVYLVKKHFISLNKIAYVNKLT